jgi:multidrug efflux system outer membrane protein
MKRKELSLGGNGMHGGDMRPWLRSLSLGCLLAGLAGCMVGPKVEKPTMETPETYRSDTAAVPHDTLAADSLMNLKWWELFGDPDLDTLVHTALKENRDILIAASRIEEARAFLGFTGADMYPKLDIEASATRGDLAQGVRLPAAENFFFIAPILSWEIDFWGKFRSARDAARSDLFASQYGLRKLQVSLISDVVSTYFLLLDFKRRLEVSERTLQLREQSLDIIQKRFNKGILPEIDVHQARIQREIAAAAIPLFERRIARTENGLSILLGRFPGEFEAEAGPDLLLDPPEIPAGLPSQLLERRPDIAEADYLFRAQTSRVGVAEALRFPAISLTGVLGLASSDLSQLTSDGLGWSVSGSLFGPIFNFNKNIRRVEIEEERMRQALLQYENTVLIAFREVEGRQLESKQREYEAARLAAELSRSRYDKGVTSYLEVLETERSFFNVELQLSELLQQYSDAYIGLYKALGGGWITSEEMNQAQKAPGSD